MNACAQCGGVKWCLSVPKQGPLGKRLPRSKCDIGRSLVNSRAQAIQILVVVAARAASIVPDMERQEIGAAIRLVYREAFGYRPTLHDFKQLGLFGGSTTKGEEDHEQLLSKQGNRRATSRSRVLRAAKRSAPSTVAQGIQYAFDVSGAGVVRASDASARSAEPLEPGAAVPDRRDDSEGGVPVA